MGFPKDSLAQDEKVALHMHPHWKALVIPAFWSLVFLGGGAVVLILSLVAGPIAAGAVGAAALVGFLWLGFSPWVRWRSTHYVFTNKQILLKDGVFRRTERGIPLDKVNDVKIHQSLFDRMLGCGTLTTESAGEQSLETLKNLPHVRAAAMALKRLAEEYHDEHSLSDSELRQILTEQRQAGGGTSPM